MKSELKTYLLLFVAFLVGTVVLALEMVSSRYLYPYFGGTIYTWAALISVVLLAMMFGYFFGGVVADRIKFPWLLEAVIATAALHLLLLPLFSDVVLERIALAIDDVRIGALLGALVLTFLPVSLLSTFTPFAVRLTLHSLSFSGRISGKIFAVSTAGNIVGTLGTAFVLIPHVGTRVLTIILSSILLACTLLVALSKRRGVAVLVLPILALVGGPARADPPAEIAGWITRGAFYPEGPVFIAGSLFYAEMSKDRVVRWSGGRQEVFFVRKGCGPTSMSRFGKDRLVVLCHLANSLIVVEGDGRPVREMRRDRSGRRIFRPNDSYPDLAGGVYFSSSGIFSKQAPPAGRIYYLGADGSVAEAAKDLWYPNGVVVTEDGFLYVSEHLARRVLRYRTEGAGRLAEPRIFALLGETGADQIDRPDYAGPDGIEVDAAGNVYVPEYGAGRILVFSPQGHRLSAVRVEVQFVTNLAIDRGERTIVVTGAYDNRVPPFPGAVFRIANPLAGTVARGASSEGVGE